MLLEARLGRRQPGLGIGSFVTSLSWASGSPEESVRALRCGDAAYKMVAGLKFSPTCPVNPIFTQLPMPV